jgi:hypothetical protein
VGFSGFGLLPTPGSVPCTLCSPPQASSTTQDMFHIVLDAVCMWMAAERTGSRGLPPGTQPQTPTHTALPGFKNGCQPLAHTSSTQCSGWDECLHSPWYPSTYTTSLHCSVDRMALQLMTWTSKHYKECQPRARHSKRVCQTVVHPTHDAFGLDMTSPHIK